MNTKPPPIIDSAKLVFFAHNDDDVEYTDRINLYIGTSADNFDKIGELPNLAITKEYYANNYLLMLCDEKWNAKGIISFTTCEEAKIKAERGYKGVTEKWQKSTYSQEDIDDFLRDEYEVDPKSEWWIMFCSFCRKESDELDQVLNSENATICKSCVFDFYKVFKENS